VIITRSPLRISLGGGGTDLPSYYREHGGYVISAAIDKYVYITVHESFSEGIILKYSKLEAEPRPEDIKHPIVREALKLLGFEPPLRMEVTSMSDIPAGTGLGSSGSFTTALLLALHYLKKDSIAPRELAEMACHIELERLQEPIGKQDQYIAAFGGITCFNFEPGGGVCVQPLRLSPTTLHNLEDNLILFFTGYTRSASDILRDQDTRSKQNDSGMLDNLHFIKKLAFESRTAMETGDLRRFGALMCEHWEHKKQRTKGMSNPQIDQYYDLARSEGALGGKLIGAGGGGFLMFYTEDKTRLRRAMTDAGLREIRFRFDFAGSQVVVHS
jgi:D-glycero-alpha-D-manno-heptose-7-phosphate kinase